MPDDTATAVAEPPVKVDAPSEVTADAGQVADAKAVKTATTPQEYVTHPDTGQRIALKDGEKDWLAQQGYRALQQQDEARKKVAEKPQEPASEPEPKNEPAAKLEEPEDDVAMQRVKRLEAELGKAQEALGGIQQREQQREAVQQQQAKTDGDRRMLDELARQHGIDKADPIDREAVEDRANRIANNALRDQQVKTFDNCYGQAKKEIGERLGQGDRAWLAAKKDAADKATEPPGGASVAELPGSPVPKNREESRKLAAEMEDGTVTERAHARFNSMVDRENI